MYLVALWTNLHSGLTKTTSTENLHSYDVSVFLLSIKYMLPCEVLHFKHVPCSGNIIIPADAQVNWCVGDCRALKKNVSGLV